MFGSTRYLPVLKDRTLERSEGGLIIPTRNLDQQMCKDQFPVRPGESSTPLLCFYLIPGSDSLNLRLSPLDSGRSSSQNHSIYRPSQISPLLPLCIEPQLRLGFRTSKVEFVHLHYTDTHNHTHVAPHTRHEHMDEPKEKKRGPKGPSEGMETYKEGHILLVQLDLARLGLLLGFLFFGELIVEDLARMALDWKKGREKGGRGKAMHVVVTSDQ
jgi:hypothetical protein